MGPNFCSLKLGFVITRKLFFKKHKTFYYIDIWLVFTAEDLQQGGGGFGSQGHILNEKIY
jgi:hypothetical protein